MNPFSMMDSMLSDPFFNMGGFGGDPFQMQSRMENMMNFSNTMIPQNGSFSSSTMVYSSSIGPDGKPQVTQFSRSTVGDGRRAIAESQEMYYDSSSGVNRLANERIHGADGHRIIREENRTTGHRSQQDIFRGNVNENNVPQFHNEFNANRGRLPAHNHMMSNPHMMLGGSNHPQAPSLTNNASQHRGDWSGFQDFSNGLGGASSHQQQQQRHLLSSGYQQLQHNPYNSGGYASNGNHSTHVGLDSDNNTRRQTVQVEEIFDDEEDNNNNNMQSSYNPQQQQNTFHHAPVSPPPLTRTSAVGKR
eukprot:GDKK01022358.1.p1 GENE.GDKK01022358.1~~GDKK01022358.1.p1  ORF type:complete len:322 (-),score=79.57 GDKK01022358.1:199-1110(-)